MSQLVRVVKSASRRGVEYEIRRGPDGSLFCSCSAWRFSPARPKHCKHVAAYVAEQMRLAFSAALRIA